MIHSADDMERILAITEPTEEDSKLAREALGGLTLIGTERAERDIAQALAAQRALGLAQAVAEIVEWLQNDPDVGEIVASVWSEITHGDGERAAYRLGEAAKVKFGDGKAVRRD